jgi:ABC-type dipeptide/oligopeptide/nickel transport system permease component
MSKESEALLKKVAKSPLASKKLWITVLGIASIVVPSIVSGGVSLPVVLGVVPAVMAYVLGQAHVDAATAKALADVAAAGLSAIDKK